MDWMDCDAEVAPGSAQVIPASEVDANVIYRWTGWSLEEYEVAGFCSIKCALATDGGIQELLVGVARYLKSNSLIAPVRKPRTVCTSHAAGSAPDVWLVLPLASRLKQ